MSAPFKFPKGWGTVDGKKQVEDLLSRLLRQNQELREALKKAIECLSEPGIQDVDEWKRDCKVAVYHGQQLLRRLETEGK